MNAEQTRGLSALAGSLGARELKDRQFQETMMMDQYVRGQQKEDEAYQLQEQQYYQMLNEKADGLLGPDREKVNQKALAFQSDIKKKIRMYGGDRKLFMQNGGNGVMANYSSSITNSEEFTTYKENKENLARILSIQEKGMGHLLVQKDVDSMQAYERNKGGKISYSGVMSEIELPDQNNYDLGAPIPMSDIMNNKENYMKILGNYRLHFPNDDNPTDEHIKAFANKMGYGGKGSNRDMLNFKMKLALINSAKKAAKEPARKADDRKVNLLLEGKKVLHALPKHITVGEIYDKGANFYVDQAKGDTRIAQNLSSDSWNYMGRKRNLDEDSFLDISKNSNFIPGFGKMVHGRDEVFGDMFKLANSASWNPGLKDKIANTVLGKEVKDGKVTLDPDENFFRADGVKLDGGRRLEKGAYEGQYDILGISTAVKTTADDGTDQLLMTVHDDNGDLDEKNTKNFADALKDNEGNGTFVIALQNKDGDTFYREVDMESQGMMNLLTNELGADVILNELHESNRLQEETDQAARSIIGEKQNRNREAYLTIDRELENSPAFEMEATDFADLNNTGLNRSDMMKSFYLAASENGPLGAFVADNSFSKTMAQTGGPEILSLLKDHSGDLSDSQLIDKWLMLATNSNPARTPEEKVQFQEDVQFAGRWKAELVNYRKANK